jgi:pimeloyl-ACP methyl ester carboxylesterase
VTVPRRPSAPEPAAVEISYPGGAAEGVAWPWPSSDLALLVLHDLDADVDAVRWLCERAASAGTHVLALDLPGHGLSGGDVYADGPALVAEAHRWLCDAASGAVGLIVHGRSAHLLLSTDIEPPAVAVAFLDPQRDDHYGPTAECWRHVPKLVVLSKGASATYAQETIAETTAWCLRADLVGLGEGGEDPEGFEIHVVSLALKFLLEQAAFALASRRTASGEER